MIQQQLVMEQQMISDVDTAYSTVSHSYYAHLLINTLCPQKTRHATLGHIFETQYSVLLFYSCFPQSGLGDGRTSGQQNSCSAYPQRFLCGTGGREPRGNGSSGFRPTWKRHLKYVACSLYSSRPRCTSPAKTDEPIEMPFGDQTRVSPLYHVFYGGAHWRHMVNAIDRSVRNCDAGYCWHYYLTALFYFILSR